MTFRRVTLVAVVVALLAVAGCGASRSGDATPTDEWASRFCSALTTWTQSMSSLTSALDSSNLSVEGLGGAVGDAAQATSTLATDLRSLGAPDTDAGVEAKDSIDRLADGIEADIEEVQTSVDDLSGITELVRALPALGRTLAGMGGRVRTTLGELQQIDTGGRLEDAITGASSCSDLTS